jgi:hypothetical protein
LKTYAINKRNKLYKFLSFRNSHGMVHKRQKQSPKNSPQNKDLVIHIYLHWSTTCTWYIWTTSFLAVFQRFKVVLISATPTVDKFTTLFLFVIIIISWKWTLTRSWLFWKWTNYNTRSKNICIFDLSIISDIYFLLTITGNWFLHSVFIRGGWQSAQKTTSPMPLSSKNWFGLVKIA